jgi:hypothetical protein
MPEQAPPTPSSPQLATDAEATPPGLPAIGKWMIDHSGTVAHWLGAHLEGKRLYEPINVILIDEGATSAEDARERLIKAVAAAGYKTRFGHSTGYRGLIGGTLYHQLPQGRDDAFSNRLFEESNNHGRVFGPHQTPEGFVFIAAFSRERVNYLEWPVHRYGSFNVARDDLARHLAAGQAYEPSHHVTLGNAVTEHPEVTTGDHDGCAVVLRAAK